MKRLAATTMIELIVVMLLSTILFSAAMLIYKIINTQYEHYALITDKVNDYDDLHHLLYQDIWNAHQVEVLDNELYCWLDHQDITYLVQEQYILRQIQEEIVHTDTFHLVQTKLEAYFNDGLIDQGLVDKVTLSIPHQTQQGTAKQFVFSKTYDYKTLEQNNLHYGN